MIRDFELIPVAEPDLSSLERSYLLKAFDSGRISSTGSFVEVFESTWAKACQSEYAISVANGTVALHLILAALNIGTGDEVIVPSLTYIASANAIRYVGAKPVFVDVKSNNWCLDPIKVEASINKKTKAIMAVHLYGNPSGIEELRKISVKHGLFLIEDAAEAPYSEVHEKRAGSFGIAAAFSFYGNKILTSGEGGAITTSDKDLYLRMKLLRGQGMDPERRYFFPEIGFNYRLTNLQCALLVAQLERANVMLARRSEIIEIYQKELSKFGMFEFQGLDEGVKPSPWLFTTLISSEFTKSRDSLADFLSIRGIESRPIFIPIHTLPPYKAKNQKSLPITENISQRGISLPTYSTLDDSSLSLIIKAISEWI